MPLLNTPTTRVHASFLAAMAEFGSEGRGTPSDNSMLGREIREHGNRWADPECFARYVRKLRNQSLEHSQRPAGYVPSTSLWWIDGDAYLGRIAIRHRLTPYLLNEGGHIGYDVRPSARRRGHATAMLAAALPLARSMGIGTALLTCDASNTASRKVIEANGGVLEDQRGTTLRFWVPAR